MQHLHETTDEESKNKIRLQLDHMFSGKCFQTSVRRHAMLKYIVEETLAGRESCLKATTIAMEVFGRGPDFDQQSDPVVRLEAHKLRRDLDSYYAGPGWNDSIRISIPKGHYIPKFESRETQTHDPFAKQLESKNGYNRMFQPISSFLFRYSVILLAFVAVLAVSGFLISGGLSSYLKFSSASEKKVTILIDAFGTRTDSRDVSLIASGLVNEITSALIKFPDLAVHLRVDQIIGGSGSGTSDGHLPKIEFVVTGDVWREGEDLFVRANLISRADMEVLWSELYSVREDGHSISDIQGEISAEIASALGQQHGYVLRDARAGLLNNRHDPNLRGFACVASAQIYRRTYHRDEYQAVRDCLEATVREDPDYARAWAMLAYLRNDAARFGYEKELSRDAAFGLAREASIRAIDLAPQDTDALQAMSHVEQYSGDMERSIEFARRAVDINPNDPAALANLAIRFAIAGRFSEAVPAMRRAIDRSVAPPPFYFHVLAADHLIKKEWSAMLAAAERASADGWAFGQAMLAIAHNQLSNESAARTALEKMTKLDPLLFEKPRTWLEAHRIHPILADAVAEGLSDARKALEEGEM